MVFPSMTQGFALNVYTSPFLNPFYRVIGKSFFGIIEIKIRKTLIPKEMISLLPLYPLFRIGPDGGSGHLAVCRLFERADAAQLAGIFPGFLRRPAAATL